MCNIDNHAESTNQLMNDNETLDNASLQEFMVSLKRHPAKRVCERAIVKLYRSIFS